MAKQAKEAVASAAAKKHKALLDMLDSMGSLAKGTARAGPVGSGTMQQRNLEALLARIFPQGLPAASEAAGAAESAVAGAPSVAATGAPNMGAIFGGPRPSPSGPGIAGTGKGVLDKSGDWLKGLFGTAKEKLGPTGIKVVQFGGVAALIDMLVKGGFGIAGEVQQGLQEGQALDAQANAMNPEAMKERALQPITKAQRDQALMLLMRQLGVKQSNVADGEAWT